MECDGLHVWGMEKEKSELSPSGSKHHPNFAQEIPGNGTTSGLKQCKALNGYILERISRSKQNKICVELYSLVINK